jgi:hypothetical protein
MTLLGKSPNIVPQGQPQLLMAALQILGITMLYVRALEIAGKDLLEILPTIDQVPGQVIELSSGRVDQVNRE